MTSKQRINHTMATYAPGAAWLFLLVVPFVGPSCSDDGDHDHDDGFSEACRHNPDTCGGDVGALCDHDSDCDDDFCCTEDANCAGGMCTIDCDNDQDCPSFMACEHHMCFFRCDHDSDCAEGQSCEHGDTICEWP